MKSKGQAKGKTSDRELKRDTAIKYLLESATIEDAAKKLNISRRTLQDWLTDPEFKAAYLAAQRSCLEHTIARSQYNTARALSVLDDVMADGEAKGSERVAAAKVVLDFSYKGHEYWQMRSELDELKLFVAQMRGQTQTQAQKAEGEKNSGVSQSQGGG